MKDEYSFDVSFSVSPVLIYGKRTGENLFR